LYYYGKRTRRVHFYFNFGYSLHSYDNDGNLHGEVDDDVGSKTEEEDPYDKLIDTEDPNAATNSQWYWAIGVGATIGGLI
jgi:hypothetical protein